MCTPPRRKGKLNQVPPERSSGKKLREVPPGAPRIVETKGKYTFRKGIRSIGEYRVLSPKGKTPSPRSSAYQCRDRFDRRQATGRRPMAIKVLGYSNEQFEEQRVPFEPKSATSLDETPVLEEWRSGGKGSRDSTQKLASTVSAETDFPGNKPAVIKQEHNDGFEVWFAAGLEAGATGPAGSTETD